MSKKAENGVPKYKICVDFRALILLRRIQIMNPKILRVPEES
jgi:hypothetical protein